MIADKFGLSELGKYVGAVGFKNGDVRTIKGVLAIVGIPITLVSEANDAIAKYDAEITAQCSNIAEIRVEEVSAEAKLVEDVAKLHEVRIAERVVNETLIRGKNIKIYDSKAEIRQLTKILGKFS